jgi:hypothetical protein
MMNLISRFKSQRRSKEKQLKNGNQFFKKKITINISKALLWLQLTCSQLNEVADYTSKLY